MGGGGVERRQMGEFSQQRCAQEEKKNDGDGLMIVARLISLVVLFESASLCVPPCPL